MSQYAYLIFSLLLLTIWFVLFFFKSTFRKEMFWVSFVTMFLALIEPIFVPEYWNPPTLFNLARRTGFDLESFIFCFAVAGIVVIVYEAIFKTKHLKMTSHEKHHRRHRFHFWVVVSAPVVFFFLLFVTNLNPIYSASIALVVGFFATWYCRPDLVKKMLLSGFLFAIIYFVVFFFLEVTFPGYVGEVWNLDALSGIIILKVPIEELMWAFTYGLYWSSVYEHLSWNRLKEV